MSNKMWTLFEQYQPYADAAGYGESWRKMTQERTSESMRAARSAAWAGAVDAASAVWVASANAAWAAENAADAAWAAWDAAPNPAEAATAAARYEVRAIEYITNAIKEAQS